MFPKYVSVTLACDLLSVGFYGLEVSCYGLDVRDWSSKSESATEYKLSRLM
jgi:hypothetical protein